VGTHTATKEPFMCVHVCRPLGSVESNERAGYIERDLEEDRSPQGIPSHPISSHLQDIAIAVIVVVALEHVRWDDFINSVVSAKWCSTKYAQIMYIGKRESEDEGIAHWI
jgi:hypothetical protein